MRVSAADRLELGLHLDGVQGGIWIYHFLGVVVPLLRNADGEMEIVERDALYYLAPDCEGAPYMAGFTASDVVEQKIYRNELLGLFATIGEAEELTPLSAFAPSGDCVPQGASPNVLAPVEPFLGDRGWTFPIPTPLSIAPIAD